MPIEDGSVRWDETLSPFVTVARLHVPRRTPRGPTNWCSPTTA